MYAWGICSENKAKNLEIDQEEPTTFKEPQVESICNVFIGNTGVFNVSKSNSEPK